MRSFTTKFGLPRRTTGIWLCLLLVLCATSVYASGFEDVAQRVQEYTLSNGMKFIILERHEAPVFSGYIYVNAGAVDEKVGNTGIAHVFEHMAFKGTSTLGTKDYEREKSLMDELDVVYDQMRAEWAKGSRADQELLASLGQEFKDLQTQVAEYSNGEEFSQILEQEGAVGLNAGTATDYTIYYYSLPSNRLELWMAMESERFFDPVLREFYKEKDVIKEERRMRVESDPVGRLIEEFRGIAYLAHPYGMPVIGHMSDINTTTRSEALQFFKAYYGPGNMVAAVVGDVQPDEVITMAERYFGRISARPTPPLVETVEPKQRGEHYVRIVDQSQPVIFIGYHKPAVDHPDDVVFDAISDILASGRTSRLYRRLVRDDKISAYVNAFSGYPGNKYPNLFLLYSYAAQGHTSEENKLAILDELETLKSELVTGEELAKVKRKAKAGLIRSLGSNMGMAQQLCSYEVLLGDWRELFSALDRIEKVTVEDIQRVAQEYFVDSNRSVGEIVTEASSAEAEEN